MRAGLLAIGILAIIVGAVSIGAAWVFAVETTTWFGMPLKTLNPYLFYPGLGLVLVGVLLAIVGIATSKKPPTAIPVAPPKPTPSVKEEIDVGRILKGSFKSYIDEPGFILLYLVPYIIILIAAAHILLTFQTFDLTVIIRALIAEWRHWIVWLSAYALVFLVLLMCVEAAIILKAGARTRGEFVGAGEAFVQGISYFPRLLGASILAGLIVVGPMVFLMLAALTAGAVGIAVLGMLLWILPAIYIMVRLALYAQACVLGDEGCIDCLAGSWRVTKGNFWLVFVVMILFGIISMVFGVIPVVGSLVASLLVTPATIIAYTFVYLGLRKRPESY